MAYDVDFPNHMADIMSFSMIFKVHAVFILLDVVDVNIAMYIVIEKFDGSLNRYHK